MPEPGGTPTASAAVHVAAQVVDHQTRAERKRVAATETRTGAGDDGDATVETHAHGPLLVPGDRPPAGSASSLAAGRSDLSTQEVFEFTDHFLDALDVGDAARGREAQWPDGRRLKLHTCCVITLQDGRIRRIGEYVGPAQVEVLRTK